MFSKWEEILKGFFITVTCVLTVQLTYTSVGNDLHYTI